MSCRRHAPVTDWMSYPGFWLVQNNERFLLRAGQVKPGMSIRASNNSADSS
jgi:hypothetical protein